MTGISKCLIFVMLDLKDNALNNLCFKKLSTLIFSGAFAVIIATPPMTEQQQRAAAAERMQKMLDQGTTKVAEVWKLTEKLPSSRKDPLRAEARAAYDSCRLGDKYRSSFDYYIADASFKKCLKGLELVMVKIKKN
jgi:hypothetical protein